MTVHVLTYSMTPEMHNRAMVLWAKSTLNRAQKRWRMGVQGLTMFAFVAISVVLLQYDVVTPTMLFSATAGFYAAVLLWLVTYRRSIAKLTGYATEALLRQGQVTADLGAENITFHSDLSSCKMDWGSIDEVMEMKDATVLRAGARYPRKPMACRNGN